MHRLLLLPAVVAVLSLAFRALAADPAPINGDAPAKKIFHVVSLKFKEGTTKEQITAVEKAFVGLKEKIHGIQSFDWGVNSSPEKRNKGFTHCFILTFANEGDRDDYLNHADHKAFGAVLGPVKEDVMVIDFWAEQAPAGELIGVGEKVVGKLFHVVSLQFKEGTKKEQITEVEKAFAALKTKIPNITSLDWGTNVSPEHKDKGFTHTFVLTFPTETMRDDYIKHDAHKAFGKFLGPVLQDVMVMDFWTQR